MTATDLQLHRKADLKTRNGYSANAIRDISASLTAVLADVFALYLKTKNFHWHMSGPHFRDFHLMLDEHGAQLIAMTDPLAERVRKVGGTTIRSVGDVAAKTRILDNDEDFVSPFGMLAELREDNEALVLGLRQIHGICAEYSDIASTSLIEGWIDETEKRVWFLFELGRETND